MAGNGNGCVIHLRLSDLRAEDADTFDSRAEVLRALADRLGWPVKAEFIENDLDKHGRRKPASAYKDKLVTLPGGRQGYRTDRPRWRAEVLDRLLDGLNLISEDADREARNVRDGEDLLDATRISGASVAFASDQPPDPDDPPVLALTRGGTESQRSMLQGRWQQATKASADTARRVRGGRKRLAAAGSYGGGRRPFGYEPDPHAPKYHKTLIQVPAEAAEIDRAEAAVMADVSLKAIARDLRDRQVPTVTGAPWSAETLRDVLTKPALAGLTVTRGTDGRQVLRPANWPPILERDRWEALCAKLDDRGREYGAASTGNEPRHLCSGWTRCHCGAPVKIGGGGGGRSYVCTGANHLRRAAAASDAWVSAWVIARLERGDAATLLAPPPRPGVDVRALRAEQKRLAAIGGRQAAMHAVGEIGDDELRAGSAARKRRLDAIAADLAATSETDPLAEFRGADARQVWESLPMPRKRAVAALLVRVTFKRAGRRGSGFDPESVDVQPAA